MLIEEAVENLEDCATAALGELADSFPSATTQRAWHIDDRGRGIEAEELIGPDA